MFFNFGLNNRGELCEDSLNDRVRDGFGIEGRSGFCEVFQAT